MLRDFKFWLKYGLPDSVTAMVALGVIVVGLVVTVIFSVGALLAAGRTAPALLLVFGVPVAVIFVCFVAYQRERADK